MREVSALTSGMLVLVLLVPVADTRAQGAPAGEKLAEREEVTALDLVVGVRRGEAVIEPPRDLAAAAFTVESDERPIPVVATDAAARTEPWHFLVVVDRRFAGVATARWATAAIAELTPRLVELGAVEVMLITEDAQTLVAPTRDAAILDEMISGLFLGAARHALVDLREEAALVLRDLRKDDRRDLAMRVAAEERRLIVDHLDEIANRIVEAPATARRALLLISDGFDLEPAALAGETSPSLAPVVDEWAETVASYGWTVIALATPVDEKLNFGFVPASDLRTIGGTTPGLTARLDGNLDPKRAAALHELGQRLAESGDWEQAISKLREALRSYYEHPKYARQRAAVLVDLGNALLAQDETREARDALRRAVALDPERADDVPFSAARFEAPSAPLERAIEASAGRLVRDAAGLATALAELGERLRVTVQIEGAPDGEIHPVTVRVARGGLSLEAPRWMRFGTPASVQAVRARRLLDGHLEDGDLALKARFVVGEQGYGERHGELEIEVPASVTADPGRLRVTVVGGSESGSETLLSAPLALAGSVARVPITVRDELWLAVVVDDLVTGRWGGTDLEP